MTKAINVLTKATNVFTAYECLLLLGDQVGLLSATHLQCLCTLVDQMVEHNNSIVTYLGQWQGQNLPLHGFPEHCSLHLHTYCQSTESTSHRLLTTVMEKDIRQRVLPVTPKPLSTGSE